MRVKTPTRNARAHFYPKIREVLRKHGERTLPEIAEELQVRPDDGGGNYGRLATAMIDLIWEKSVRISRTKIEPFGPRPYFVLEEKPDPGYQPLRKQSYPDAPEEPEETPLAAEEDADLSDLPF